MAFNKESQAFAEQLKKSSNHAKKAERAESNNEPKEKASLSIKDVVPNMKKASRRKAISLSIEENVLADVTDLAHHYGYKSISAFVNEILKAAIADMEQ